ncbi:MAG TPA: ABC transporter substrate-binding protein, partial [Acidimicrobiales bacterium]
MNLGRIRPQTRRLVAVATLVTIAGAGCGARLTRAQLAALNSSGDSTGLGTGPGSGTGPGLGGTGSSGTVATSGSRGASAGTVTGRTSGGIIAGGTTRSGGTTGSGRGGGAGGGSGGAVAVNDPLAGPGGKICPSGTPGSGPGVTATTITLGNIVTINGPVPGLFAGARYGTQAFADWANSMGGLCGRKVVVNSADDQFDQATDQSEAQSMASQILSFVGSFSLQDSGIPNGAPGVPDVGQTLTSNRFHSATNFSPQPNPP